MRDAVRGDKHNLRKSANRNVQISVIHSAQCTLYWFVLCNLQIFSGCVCHLEQLHAQSSFLFPIVFSINLIPFFNICSVLAVLLPGLFGYVMLYMCCFTWATAWSQQLLFVVLAAGLWCFTAGWHVKSPLFPPTLSQTEVCSMMGESIRPLSFHNPTPSANKLVVQICCSSLSAAVQTVQVSVEPHLSTALKDRSVVP